MACQPHDVHNFASRCETSPTALFDGGLRKIVLLCFEDGSLMKTYGGSVGFEIVLAATEKTRTEAFDLTREVDKDHVRISDT